MSQQESIQQLQGEVKTSVGGLIIMIKAFLIVLFGAVQLNYSNAASSPVTLNVENLVLDTLEDYLGIEVDLNTKWESVIRGCEVHDELGPNQYCRVIYEEIRNQAHEDGYKFPRFSFSDMMKGPKISAKKRRPFQTVRSLTQYLRGQLFKEE